jgi:hypothetical protein
MITCDYVKFASLLRLPKARGDHKWDFIPPAAITDRKISQIRTDIRRRRFVDDITCSYQKLKSRLESTATLLPFRIIKP